MKNSSFLSSLVFGSVALAFSLPAAAELPPPPGFSVFEATPGYQVQTRDGLWTVPLYLYGDKDMKEHRRRFDFVAPIINPSTGRMNALSLQTPYSRFYNLNDNHMANGLGPIDLNAGSPKRVEYNVVNGEGRLTVAYRPGDPPSSDKLRVMVNSWPVPLYRQMTYDLSFKLGGEAEGEEWPVEQGSPKLLWQIKSDNPDASLNSFPSMGFWVSPDDRNPDLISLTFFRRTQNVADIPATGKWTISGLRRGEFIDVRVRTVLNDRDDANGILDVWVNGTNLVYRTGRNLIQLPSPDNGKAGIVDRLNRFAFGVYLMSHENPTQQTFVTQWRRARLLIPN